MARKKPCTRQGRIRNHLDYFDGQLAYSRPVLAESRFDLLIQLKVLLFMYAMRMLSRASQTSVEVGGRQDERAYLKSTNPASMSP